MGLTTTTTTTTGGTSARKYLMNSGGGFGFSSNKNMNSGGRWKLRARRRRKRQGVGVGDNNSSNANGRGNMGKEAATPVVVMTTTRTVAKITNGGGNNNNNNRRRIYGGADNDKEAFLRNYELNINSPALRRMNSFKGGGDAGKQRQDVDEDVSAGASDALDDEVDLDNAMLNDDNAGVLNAVAAVQNGDMVDKHRDDNWLDETDEYYPSRDHFSDLQNLHMPFWDSYDSINQLYLEIGELVVGA